MRSELDTDASNEQRSTNASPPVSPAAPNAPHDRPVGRRLVESVRLIMVPLFAGAGWQTASSLTHARTELLAGVVVGSGVGYVLGGVFGRRTVAAVSKVEREFRRISAGDILAGSIGLVLGMVMAVLVSVPLFHLPPPRRIRRWRSSISRWDSWATGSAGPRPRTCSHCSA